MKLAEVRRPADTMQFCDGLTTLNGSYVLWKHGNGMLNAAFVDGHVHAMTKGEESEEPQPVAGAQARERRAVALHVHRPEKLDGEWRHRGVGHDAPRRRRCVAALRAGFTFPPRFSFANRSSPPFCRQSGETFGATRAVLGDECRDGLPRRASLCGDGSTVSFWKDEANGTETGDD
jgi:prepilin-type processing-associated H-X9-DG protein